MSAKRLLLAALCMAAIGATGFSILPLNAAESAPVVIKYWEKWTGFEGDAMRAVVDDFNASQNRIFVDYSTVSQLDRRLMLATAGGVPPDVAGIYGLNVPVYAENNALTPLDRFARESGVKGEDYIPILWDICRHRDHLWALPSTPSSTALVYNKKLFREAGLDPEKPPRTMEELEAMNEKLSRKSASGRLEKIGHLPEEPGWWNGLWGYWYGANMFEGNRITANSPENLAAYRWVQSYPERFGANELLGMRDGFGNFASPQNGFFTGRVAIVLQGVWIYNFIKNYAPADFEWGVAAFPSVDSEKMKDVCLVETDLLVIPAGAKHPREAFEFIAYVNSPGPMEKLCLGQRKFSPLRECSAEFFANHPNPYIHKFLELAKSPNARIAPRLTTWNEYAADMKNAVTRIWSGTATDEEALGDVQKRQQKSFDRRMQRWERMGPTLTKLWNAQ